MGNRLSLHDDHPGHLIREMLSGCDSDVFAACVLPTVVDDRINNIISAELFVLTTAAYLISTSTSLQILNQRQIIYFLHTFHKGGVWVLYESDFHRSRMAQWGHRGYGPSSGQSYDRRMENRKATSFRAHCFTGKFVGNTPCSWLA